MEVSISAGIVLFNPDIERLKKNVQAIIEQVDKIYLQDNGSSNFLQVKKLFAGNKKIEIMENPNNRGIAWALNRLCNISTKEGFSWILTLDQDSVCPSDIILKYQKYLEMGDMLCPRIIDRNAGEISKINSQEYEYVNKCITSGSLLRLKTWNEIGGFDENMFIDGVDFEFCYRAIINNKKIIQINSVCLYHEIGNIKIHHFVGLKVIVKNHSPFRKYYIARNIIYIQRKRKSHIGIIKALMQEVKLLGIVILYEEQKKDKIKMIIKGTKDGFIQKISL